MPRGKHGNHRRGPGHHRWNAKRIVSADGYVKLRVGIGHPLADPNGYAYEHLVVWVAAARTAPGEGELLHHRNGQRTDNRIENLQKLSRAEHNALHNAIRGRDDLGRLLPGDGRDHREFPA